MTLLITLLFVYALWVIIYLGFQIRTLKRQLKIPPKKSENGGDLVVKCHHHLRQIASNELKQSQSESPVGNANTFVGGTQNEQPHPTRSAQIPSQELDETFTNSPLKLDVQVGYETLDDNETVDDNPNDFARGVSFDEISSAMDTAQRTTVDKGQELDAGRTFAEIENTDMCEQITNCSAMIAQRVTELIAMFQNETQEPPMLRVTSDSFDIENYL